MTTCTTVCCGTGGWTGPLPGDPETTSIRLSVSPQLGGLTVRWTYPSVNPEAVAFVRVYRGTSSDFVSALEIGTASGTSYYDSQSNDSIWFYWIKVVSVHGTESDLIGPASGKARLLSEDIADNLTGIIDFDALDAALKEPLQSIPFLQNKLLQEIYDRETGQVSLADAIQQANDGVASAMTFIGQATNSLTSDNRALAESLRVTAAVLESGIAAVTEEISTEVTRLGDAITAESTLRTQVVAQVDNKYATITNDQNTRITSVNGRVTSEATRTDQLISNVGNRITGVQQDMDVIADEVNDIYSSAWKVRVEANGLIGGFGLLNNGQNVQAGFDVDEFYIGRTQANKVKPFMIDSAGITYIDKARIGTAWIDTHNLSLGAGTVLNSSSSHYSSGSNPLNGAYQTNAGTGARPEYWLAICYPVIPARANQQIVGSLVTCSISVRHGGYNPAIPGSETKDSSKWVLNLWRSGVKLKTWALPYPSDDYTEFNAIFLDTTPFNSLPSDLAYTLTCQAGDAPVFSNNFAFSTPRVIVQTFLR